MKKFKVGLIRVITSDDKDFINTHGHYIEERFPNLEVESRCIPDQWEGVHNPELKRIAASKVVELAKQFQGVGMILVSCADDPGLEEIRQILPEMPVAGGGEATATIASRYSGKVGVIGIVDDLPQNYKNILSDRAILVKPNGVDSTLDLMTERGRRNCILAAKSLKDSGVKVIALACTGFNTIDLANVLEKETRLPVIDPVLAQGVFAAFEAAKALK